MAQRLRAGPRRAAAARAGVASAGGRRV